jgi:two-component system LytT family response regulator
MPEQDQPDVLIVDDEALARRGLRMMLRDELGWTRVRDAASGPEAIAAIREKRPDLVLLDIHLGTSNGFSVVEAFDARAMPPVIFVTAYDQYALQAFEAHAVDYLLKPIDPDRLRDAVERAMKLMARDDHAALRRAVDAATQMIADLRAHPAGASAGAERIAVRDGVRTVFLDPDEITHVEAAGNNVRIHSRDHTYTLRSTMDALEERLGGGFIRPRRAVLVRRAVIRACTPLGRGTYAIELDDGTRVTSSRYFRDAIVKLVR